MIGFKEFLLESIKKTGESLSSHYSRYTPEHINTLKKYTEHSADINTALNKGKEHELVKPMDNAVNAHTTPKKMTVYAGLHHTPEHETGSVEHKGFMSTSLDKSVANGFAGPDKTSKFHNERAPGHMLKLSVPKGTHSAFPGTHAAKEGTGEHELVLPRGSKYKVSHSVYDPKENLVTHHAKLI